jgi:hypothetical protein
MTSNTRDSERHAEPMPARLGDPVRPPWLKHLAHDLRNPLSTLHTGIALLRSGRLGADQQSNLLVTIQRQLDMLSQMIDDTADLLRVDIEALQTIDVADVLDRVAARLSGDLHERDIEFQAPPPGASATVLANSKGLTRLTGFLVLRIAEIIGPGNRIVATIESRGSQVRLCLVPSAAAQDAGPQFASLADGLSMPAPEHVADAALHEILRRHGARVTVTGEAVPGIALLLAAA